MANEIYPDIFEIKIPLPNYPLREGKVYVIRGNRNLIIDTGIEHPETKNVLLNELYSIGIKDFNTTDFFITHSHNDHMELIGQLNILQSTVYCHRKAADMFINGHDTDFKKRIETFAIENGLDRDVLSQGLKAIPLNKSHHNNIKFTFLNSQQTLKVGRYNFICIESPGHSQDHIILYEPNHKLLFTGDHVSLYNPQISIHKYGYDLLGIYLNNIAELAKMPINLALPFHNKKILNFAERVEEIQEYYQGRFQEIQGIIQDKSLTAYQIASKMSWPFNWNKTSAYAHLANVLVASAYLEHMLETDKLNRISKDGVSLFHQ